MNTTIRAGQVLESGFEILDLVDLAELNARGIWAKHRKSGLEVFHVLNDDRENLFAFAFATVPEDSTGVAHILEHSVLCGSENYPLKDAFLVLAQGSLQTYLNAWTFPDKTVYPASSVNEHDYFNLMAVYGDAVFRPLLSEWTFMQEAYRLELLPAEAGGGSGEERLSITGVVYNEMKGAYSSIDRYTGHWSIRGVLPDTPYAFESGGDPEQIPELTWDGLREFHRTRYAPGNCRVFLAGNIPTEKQLAFIAEKLLSGLSPGKAAPPIPLAERWQAPQTITVPCPAGAEQKSTVILSWLCGDAGNSVETLTFLALGEALLGHDGSPLTRALIESGLGEDLAPVTGLEGDLRETVFTVGLRGVKQEQGAEKAVEALILKALRRLVKEGIPKEEIEATLLSLEFSNREIRRSGGPWSLAWLQRSLRAWLHGGKPWDRLLFIPAFTTLKQHLAEEPRYFEALIQKYFLDNPHRALIAVKPEADFLEKQEAKLAKRLTQTVAALGEKEKQLIREKAAALERIQGTGESPEVLARIPHLSRKDLSPEIERVPRQILDAAGIPVLVHDLFTNGITYVDLAFPLDILAPRDYPWLPFFSKAIVSLGLPGMDYGEVSSLLARTVGGFYGLLETGSPVPGMSRTAALPSGILDITGRDWLVYRLKASDEKIAPSLDLALRLITEADFTDPRRIRDLVLEMKNELDANLAPDGHSYAACRGARYVSRSRGIDEIWNGLSQIEFIHRVAALDTEEISRTLIGIRDTLISKAGLIINLTGSGETLSSSLQSIGERFGRFGSPRSRNPLSTDRESFFPLLGDPVSSPERHEVFVSPSLQIGFAGMILPSAPFGSPEQAVEAVLAHQLSTGALWEDIRMKGGAYGAFAYPDNLERAFSLSTYRDPNPLRSLDAFSALLEDMACRPGDEEFLEKAVIGTYSKETRPRTAAENGISDFLRFLYGIADRHRAQKLGKIIAVSGDEITGVARRLAGHTAEASAVILAGPGIAEKAAVKLGLTAKALPV